MTDKNKQSDKDGQKHIKKMPKWLRRTLKTIMWISVSSVALVILLMCLAVWVLTPNVLTPIVEDIASRQLLAEVKLQKAELTIWKTFPEMVVEVDGIEIISHTLRECNDSLPDDADRLLSANKVKLAFNLPKVAMMKFDIKEVWIDSPRINLVEVNDSINNYMIVPPSDKSEPSSVIINEFTIRKFHITDNKGFSYKNLEKGIKVELTTDTATIAYLESLKQYDINICGHINSTLKEPKFSQSIPYAIKGGIRWDFNNPYEIETKDFLVSVADIPATISSSASFSKLSIVKSLDLSIGPLNVSHILSYVPEEMKGELNNFATNMSPTLTLHLDAPYELTVKHYPSFSATLEIPDCYLANTRSGSRINNVLVDAGVKFIGTFPDKSVITVNRLLLDGFGLHIDASGKADNLIKDPAIEAKVAGNLNIAKALGLIPKRLPFSLSGRIGINTDMKFALSDFSVKTFHKIKLNGNITADNIRYFVPKDSMQVFVDHSILKFGTDSKITGADGILRNMLMASISLDSLAVTDPITEITATNARFGVGARGNVKNLMDTTSLTPLGGRFSVGKFSMFSAVDSTRINVRDMVADASVRRFNGKDRMPIFTFGISANRIRYSDPLTMLNLREGDIDLTINKKERRQNSKMESRLDSMSLIYPELSRDSLRAIYRQERRARRKAAEAADTNYYADLSIDNQWQRLIRNWEFNGSIKARRGRFFTPYFPLRNRLSNVDITFNSQRLDVNNLEYRVGKSDLQLTGALDNINSTLLGRKAKPLTLTLKARSKTLDLNELMAAMYRGSNFSAEGEGRISLAGVSDDDEESIQRTIESSTSADSDTLHYAILIPKNIVMDIDLRNDTTYYSDFVLHNLHSSIGMKNGVLNLHDLSAKSNDGDMRLDLVYATASSNNIGIGMLLDMHNIKVNRFINLMPEIDSIMPMLKGVDGVINARLAATTRVDSLMNVIMPTTTAALNISGKNLVLLDNETFREIAKMLRFKNREKNMIDSLSVEVTAYDAQIDVYPFIISMDRYKLGVVGWNDFDTNYKYHISVLDSPLFFKFGINLSGNVMEDKMKFRLGKAKLRENEVARTTAITDTTRYNIYSRMGEIFRAGAEAGLKRKGDDRIRPRRSSGFNAEGDDDRLTATDSLQLIESGIIERPDTTSTGSNTPITTGRKGKGKRNKNNPAKSSVTKPVATKNED